MPTSRDDGPDRRRTTEVSTPQEGDALIRLVNDSGPAVLQLRGHDGRWVRLHSARDPEREAARWLDEALGQAPPPPVLAVVGLGRGYLLDELDRRGAPARVLAVEPDPKAAAAALERPIVAAWLGSGRLRLLAGPSYHGSSACWRLFAGDPEARHLVLVHPVWDRERPVEVAAARELIARIAFGARQNAAARAALESRYLVNVLGNIPRIALEADAASLAGAATGVPAILAAAGPSLDAALPRLAALGSRALVIAVDTATRPLLASGIRPHLVVAVDPSDVNARHLDGVRPGPNTWLVAESSMAPAVFAGFTGRTFTFRVSDAHPWLWLEANGLTRGSLAAWGSVLTVAFDLAVRMGCGPIVLVGADLAFTGGRPYCRGTRFETDWAAAVASGLGLPDAWQRGLDRAGRMTTPDLRGSLTETSPQMVSFRDWLVERAADRPDIRVVNATGSGILHGGSIEQSDLDAAALEWPLAGELDDRLRAAHARSVASAAFAAARGASLQRTALGLALDPAGPWAPILDDRDRADLESVLEATVPAGAADGHPAADASDGPSGADERSGRASMHAAPLATVPATGPLAGLYPPERTALVRAVLDGTPVPGWVVARPADSASPLARRGRVEERVLRAAGRLALAPGAFWHPSSGNGADAPTTAFESEPARHGVAADAGRRRRLAVVESALAETLALAGSASEGWRPDARWDTPDYAWRDDGPTSPSVAPDPARHAGHLDARWRFDVALGIAQAVAVARASLAGRATAPGDPDQPRRVCDLLWDLRRANPVHAGGADSDRCDLDAVVTWGARPSIRAPRFAAAVSARRLMRSLTGRLVDDDPGARPGTLEFDATPGSLDVNSGRLGVSLSPRTRRTASGSDPRLRFVARRGRWVNPLVLPTSGGSGWASVATSPTGLALAMSADRAESVWVAPDGSIRPHASWPRRATGVAPWGEDGAIAWFSGTHGSYLMLRRDPRAAVEVMDLPFRPSWPVVAAGGRTVWCSYFGGLWEWTPTRGVRRLADAPPAKGIRPLDGGFRLDLVTKDEGGHMLRGGRREALRFGPDGDILGSIDPGPLGISWSESAGGGWIAEAFPDADLVRLTAPGGGVADLACALPLQVAWTGGSLVVVSGSPRCALLFADLVSRAGAAAWMA